MPSSAAVRGLPRTVIALGFVSFFTDVAADMVTPYLAVFLTANLHASTGFVGAVEGAAEATAALMKYLGGHLSDRSSRRKPLVIAGYAIANLARPFVALAVAPWQVLAVRLVDRVGKGLRTAPRDALIVETTAPDRRAYAFGFHRGLDNLGAVFGPLAALGVLHVTGADLRMVFAATVVPGLVSVLVLIFGVREVTPLPREASATTKGPALPFSSALRRYLVWVGIFTLGNASDVFLILRARDLGVPNTALPLCWGALSLLRAVAAAPGGRVADHIGRTRALSLGWALYALAYLAFGYATQPWHCAPALVVYGAYYGLTEGTERALVASLAPRDGTGRAFGLFSLVTGALALPASLMFGALYPLAGTMIAFATAAAFAAIASVGLLLDREIAEPRNEL